MRKAVVRVRKETARGAGMLLMTGRRAARMGAAVRIGTRSSRRKGIMKGVRLRRNERVDSLDHLGRRIIQRKDGFCFGEGAEEVGEIISKY